MPYMPAMEALAPDPRPAADAIGFVAPHPRRGDRLALFHPSGELSNSFAVDEDREAVAAILARNGLRLAPDGTVFRAAEP
jgi:hypothetical protein